MTIYIAIIINYIIFDIFLIFILYFFIKIKPPFIDFNTTLIKDNIKPIIFHFECILMI